MSAVTYTATRKIHEDHTASELVTNGDMSSSTGWTLNSGWSIGSGILTAASPSAGNAPNNGATQTITTVVGYEYSITVNCLTTDANWYMGASGLVTTGGITTTGLVSINFTAASTSALIFIAAWDSGLDATFDDFSCQLSGSFDLDIVSSQLNESWPIKKNPQISLDGTQETIFHHQDQIWNFTSTLISKAALTSAYWYEFIASVYAGETFTFDPYGTVASPDEPISVVMVGSPTIAREGQVGYFRVSFQVREV